MSKYSHLHLWLLLWLVCCCYMLFIYICTFPLLTISALHFLFFIHVILLLCTFWSDVKLHCVAPLPLLCAMTIKLNLNLNLMMSFFHQKKVMRKKRRSICGFFFEAALIPLSCGRGVLLERCPHIVLSSIVILKDKEFKESGGLFVFDCWIPPLSQETFIMIKLQHI